MALLGIDLGGTKVAAMLLTDGGKLLSQDKTLIGNRGGREVSEIIQETIRRYVGDALREGDPVSAVGVSVPGIYYSKKGNVWAPNIAGWDDYPLLDDLQSVAGSIPIAIDSDRACYILGETWKGNARGCRDAIYLAVGTGIGAGILVDGRILRGANDIAGAIGWMALRAPFAPEYVNCGCFEYHASGKGLAMLAGADAFSANNYNGPLAESRELSTHDVFAAYEQQDPVATTIIHQGIGFWGMAIANLVSLFNPEKIILGGGVFGPALALIPAIKAEAQKWAQPISSQLYELEGSGLGTDAGVYGAAFLAMNKSQSAT